MLPWLPTIQSHSKDNLAQVCNSRSDGLEFGNHGKNCMKIVVDANKEGNNYDIDIWKII